MTRKLRKERVEAREEAILNAAHAVFSEHGFKGARMLEIAEKADVAEGTLYLYFRNKDALLGGVIGRFYAVLTQSAEIGVQKFDQTLDRLRFLATHHLQRCLEEWRILELMVGQYREVAEYENSGYAALNRTYVAVFDGVIREAVARGEIHDDLTTGFLRDMFYGTLEYACRTAVLHKGQLEDTRPIVERLMIVFERGVISNCHQASPPFVDSAITRLEKIAGRLEILEKARHR